MRANGYPNFPDPVENGQGGWEIPESPDVPATIDPPACAELVRNAKQGTEVANAPSAEDMAKLRQYASCMREHGAPNFPDPDSQGNFDLPPELRNDPARDTAHEACKQYAPPPRPK
jgi:hypothetical protein